MDKVIEFFEGELASLRTGRPNPAIVEDIKADVYGTPTPLKQIAQISTPDASTIVITPWDKSNLAPIETALKQSDLGGNPINDGSVIRVGLPPMTEERRTELTKVVNEKLEAARVALRNLRREAIAAAEKEDLPEDALKQRKDELTEQTAKYNKQLEELADAKKQEIMTV